MKINKEMRSVLNKELKDIFSPLDKEPLSELLSEKYKLYPYFERRFLPVLRHMELDNPVVIIDRAIINFQSDVLNLVHYEAHLITVNSTITSLAALRSRYEQLNNQSEKEWDQQLQDISVNVNELKEELNTVNLKNECKLENIQQTLSLLLKILNIKPVDKEKTLQFFSTAP